MKRIILSAIMSLAILAGCGNSHPVAYRPTAYGENNQCFYVNSPLETQALMDQGLCDRSWAPTLIPLYWHSRYFNYYASPAYYNVYVPVASRATYSASERVWGSTNKSTIATESKKATYQGSNGKTVTADKIGAAKYGGGARFGPVGTKFGGGSGRASETPAPAPAPAPAVKVPSSPSKSPSVKAPSSPSKSPSSPSKGYGGGSGRPSGGYSGGGSKSYGGGGGRR